MAAIGVARAQSYAQALACRLLMGFGGSIGLCFAPAAISDVFFLLAKGRRTGVNSFTLAIAPYAGGIARGSIQQNKNLGWRWATYTAAILYTIQFTVLSSSGIRNDIRTRSYTACHNNTTVKESLPPPRFPNSRQPERRDLAQNLPLIPTQCLPTQPSSSHPSWFLPASCPKQPTQPALP